MKKLVFAIAVALGIATVMLMVAKHRYLTAHYPEDEWNASCSADPRTDRTHRFSIEAANILRSALAEDNGAGISAAVTINGKLIWRGAIGIANDGQVLSVNSRLRIGSVSKAFTAVVAARLHEQGLLDIDSPLKTYAPELQGELGDLTARQLATHTSGIRQYDFSDLQDSNNTAYTPSLADAFSRHLNDVPQHAPGERVTYSSIGFNLLGIVVERVSDERYADGLTRWVTEPLGLTHTTVDDSTIRTACRPSFYTVLFGKIRLPTMWRDNSDLFPSGGLLSSGSDLAKFGDAVFGSTFLKPETRMLLQQNAQLNDGKQTRRAFGWEVELGDDGTVEWIGHGGTINGAYASLRYYPAFDMTVAGISNYDIQLASERAAFFHALRVRLPALFSQTNLDHFSD